MANSLSNKHLGELVDLTGTLRKRWKEISDELKTAEEDGLDALNRDLLAAEAHALLTLLGITQMRLGLNLSHAAGSTENTGSDNAAAEKEETDKGT